MAAGNWEVRVAGVIPDGDLLEFPDMAVTVRPGETVLRGKVRDEAELYGMLNRIQLLGVVLIGLRRLPDESDTTPSRAATTARRVEPP